jgi:hypothetical protein
MKPKDIPDTAATPPIEHIARAALFGTSRSIEMQEAEGQRALLESQARLPVESVWGDRHIAHDVLRGFGVVFGEKQADGLFYEVTLPEGWRIVSGDGPMWSYLLDEKGRQRASIFYKAAFYDRKAHIRAETRFRTRVDYDAQNEAVRVLDGLSEIHRVEATMPGGLDHVGVTAFRRDLWERAGRWLDERYPGWTDPAAHWDTP